MKRLYYTGAFIGLFLFSAYSLACTTWGSIGDRSMNHGLLIAKNRDICSPSPERLQMFHPKQGYAYFALIYKDYPQQHNYPYISAGINSQGLVVVDNDASTTPTHHRDARETVVMRYMLQHCRDVSQVLAKQKQLFTTNKINDLLIGDQHTLALIEIGKQHKYKIWVKHNGVLFHTNNYVAKNLLSQNKTFDLSSVIRYRRISTLLHSKHSPLTFENFYQFSNDQHAGIRDSIFRAGTATTPSSPRTVATWITSIPQNGVPYLYVRLTQPNQPTIAKHFYLTAKFWK